MRRVEGMSNEHSLRVFALRLNQTWLYPRCTGRQKATKRFNRIHLSVKLDLEIRTFWPVFLDEIGVYECLLHVGRKAQAVAGCARRKADTRQVLPRLVNHFAQIGFGVRRGISSNHIVAAG